MKLFQVIMQIIFLLQDNAIALLFLNLKSLRELFVFYGLSYDLKYKLEVFLFFKIQNIKSNCWNTFLKRFPIIYFCRIIYSFPVTFIYKWFDISWFGFDKQFGFQQFLHNLVQQSQHIENICHWYFSDFFVAFFFLIQSGESIHSPPL